jgi:diguanylate cyclase (GGDEF)-like protein
MTEFGPRRPDLEAADRAQDEQGAVFYSGLAGAVHDLGASEAELAAAVDERTETQLRLDAALLRVERDDKTGVLKWSAFREGVARNVALADREGDRLGLDHLLMLDIDDFGDTNEVLGHSEADRLVLMPAVEAILQASSLREKDLVGRFGGDEFGVYLYGTDAKGALILAQRIKAGINNATADNNIRTGVSIGLVGIRPGEDVDMALAQADAALYNSKNVPEKNTISYFDPENPFMAARVSASYERLQNEA